MGAGVPLGQATGTITINTSQLVAAQQAVQAAARAMNQALTQINQGANQAQAGVSGLSDSFTMLRQAAGIAGGIYGALQLVRITSELAQEAAMADRVRDAFTTMAASAGRSGDTMMAAMQKASRGMISDTNLALSANKAMLLGVADNSEQMAKLMDVARVRGQAVGMDPVDALDRIVTGVGRLSTRMLYLLGITVNEKQAFEDYAKSLGTTANHLTDVEKRTALVNAIVADSASAVAAAGGKAETNADKFDKLAASMDNAKKSAGELLLAAGAPAVVSGLDESLKGYIILFHELGDTATRAGHAVGSALAPLANLIIPNAEQTARGNIAGAENMRAGLMAGRSEMVASGASDAALAEQDRKLQAVNQQLGQFHAQLLNATGAASQLANGFRMVDPKSTVDPNLDAQNVDKVVWFEATQKVENDAAQARLDATTSYESSRSETVRSYEQGIARQEEDFGISRARQAADLAATIDRIGVDSARQAEHWARDLADSIAKATADSGKRVAEAQEATDKRIAEINEQYAKTRAKAERDHRDNLLDAAANLDAKAIFNEQKAFAKSSQDAKDAHDDQISKEKAGLEERISKEAENLADRIKQDQAANAKRLADAKEADTLRIQDAKDALAKQQAIEDQDRALRLQRAAEDQAHQLAQMDEAQVQRLAQIDRHETEQRNAADEAFQKQLDADGQRSDKWMLQQEALKGLALKQFDDWWLHIIESFGKVQGPPSLDDKNKFIDPAKLKGFDVGGYVPTNMIARLHAGEVVSSKSMVDKMGGYSGMQQMAMAGGRGGATLNLSPGSIQIYAHAGMDVEAVGRIVEQRVLHIFNNELQ